MTAGASGTSPRTVEPLGIRVRPARDERDFRAVVALRTRVFGVEQGLVGADVIDDDDARSLHAMAEIEQRDQTIVVGTGRLTLASTVDHFGCEQAQIAWVATLPEWRGRGVGGAVMRFLLDEADAMRAPSVLVSAQLHAAGLYRRFGFKPSGQRFEVGGIPHQLMVRRLQSREDARS